MNLVGAEDEVVALAKVGEPCEVLAAPDAGERVVRIAEVEEFRARCDGALPCDG